MLEHLRTQILINLADILKSNEDLNNLVNNRIYLNRLENITEEELPSILIYATEENSERTSMSRPSNIKRELTINIEIFTKPKLTNNVDKDINIICGFIEETIADNYTMNNLVIDSVYNNFYMNLNNDSSSPKGIGKLNYTITYKTMENNPYKPIK